MGWDGNSLGCLDPVQAVVVVLVVERPPVDVEGVGGCVPEVVTLELVMGQ